MAQPATNPKVVRFGLFELDLDARELRKSGVRIKLQDQPFQILSMLLEHPGTVVTREELQKKLWPGDTFVDFDLSLNSAVKKLRQALNDDSENPRFVETLYRRGYRFIGSVNGVNSSTADQIDLQSPTSGALAEFDLIQTAHPLSISRRRFLFFGAAALLLTLAGAFVYRLIPSQPLRVLSAMQLTNDSHPKVSVGTDGLRVYFTETINERWVLSQVATTGGEISQIPTPFPNALLNDVDPGRSELLVNLFSLEGVTSVGQGPLWIVPVPAGSPRRVGDLIAQGAAWSRDGQKLVYSQGHKVFLANWDGAQSRELVTIAGLPYHQRFSPDGTHVRLMVRAVDRESFTIWEIGTDGTGLHSLLPDNFHQDPGECCGDWSADGRYYFFEAFRNGRSDIWALHEKRGILRRGSPEPMPVTTGPLSYHGAAPALRGNVLFVIGEQQHSELQRLDARTGQFVPFLNGISAGELDFSRDGQWVTYVSYPDHILWRSRIDGSEKLQLTFPPAVPFVPRWSPDGRSIAFAGAMQPGGAQKAFLISPDGGTPEELLPDDPHWADDPNWSPNGKSLLLAYYPPGNSSGRAEDYYVVQYDLQTKKVSTLPGSQQMFAPRWSSDGRYISTVSVDQLRLSVLKTGTGKWRGLAAGKYFQYPNWARDSKNIYLEDVGDNGPELDRISVPDGRKERVALLKDIPRPLLSSYQPWNGLAPDNSPLIMRDVGIRELYSLELQLP